MVDDFAPVFTAIRNAIIGAVSGAIAGAVFGVVMATYINRRYRRAARRHAAARSGEPGRARKSIPRKTQSTRRWNRSLRITREELPQRIPSRVQESSHAP